MADFVRRIHPDLRGAGFVKRGHSFNRAFEDGVVQVIRFQMANKLPPGARAIPPIRLDLYGRFTVNLGVAIRESWEFTLGGGRELPRFVNEYDCAIRERLGQVLGSTVDTWWPLESPEPALTEVSAGLLGPGLEWLAARGTRDRILELWSSGGLRALPMPTAIPLTLMLLHLGRSEQAAEALRTYYDTIDDHPHHRRHVYEVAQRLGLGGLTEP